MAKLKFFEIGPIEGSGLTKTAARVDAHDKATAALARLEQHPVFVPAPASLAAQKIVGIVVYPDLQGWGYKLARSTGAYCGCTSGHKGWLDATSAAILHLGGLALDGTTETLAEVLQWYKDLVSEGEHRIQRAGEINARFNDGFDKEIRRRHVFIAAFNAYREQGLDHDEAHNAACRAMDAHGYEVSP